MALVEADGLAESESSGRPEGRSGCGGGKHDCGVMEVLWERNVCLEVNVWERKRRGVEKRQY